MVDNPMAFPMGNPTHGGYDGMTLRDYYAGQAVNGMLASEHGGDAGAGFYDPKHAANRAYEFADALLAARTPREVAK